MSLKLLEVLKQTFGYEGFRQGQSEIITSILQKKNILAIMPTGAGKSLCYQIPAIIIDKQTIVVSPLVALMDDQVGALKQNKVSAERLHSNMSNTDNNRIWNSFCSGNIKILYMSPEALMSKNRIETLKTLNIGLFAIDEAHCISKWGPGFRKDYENLSMLKDFFPNSNICAFTATADQATREDIIKKLTNNNCKLVLQGFRRPNLSLSVYQKLNWKNQLLQFLINRKGQSGIVYCLSRKNTEDVAEFLNRSGFNSIAYHAGQDEDERKNNQNIFMTKSGIIMSATIAFGMGIDKPDVRFVVHISLPSNVESYYQEVGRAGRDGQNADTLMLYGLNDLFMRRKFIEEEDSNEDHKRREHRRLDALIAYCESATCRQAALLGYFNDKTENCRICDNCINPPEMKDGTELAQQVLSAIYRTGQYFGSGYIIDILRGVESERIVKNKHNEIKTFGVGKEIQIKFWQSFIRQLISANHVSIDIKKYGAYVITESGIQILKGNLSFKYKSIETQKIVFEKQYKRSEKIDLEEKEIPLLQELKKLRLKLAKEQNVPAFVIFADQTLLHMIEKKPKNMEQMQQIVGVGPVKLERYGKVFLEILNKNLL